MIRWLHILKYVVVFVLMQTLVVDNIHLFAIVTPFIYFYAVMKAPVDISRSGEILLSFFLGLVIDIFSNTFGMHAAACAVTGFIRHPLLGEFVDMKEIPAGSVPSFRLFGYGKFLYYTLIVVATHHLILFSIDAFSFFELTQLLIRMSTSILLSTLLILIIESFNFKK